MEELARELIAAAREIVGTRHKGYILWITVETTYRLESSGSEEDKQTFDSDDLIYATGVILDAHAAAKRVKSNFGRNGFEVKSEAVEEGWDGSIIEKFTTTILKRRDGKPFTPKEQKIIQKSTRSL